MSLLRNPSIGYTLHGVGFKHFSMPMNPNSL